MREYITLKNFQSIFRDFHIDSGGEISVRIDVDTAKELAEYLNIECDKVKAIVNNRQETYKS